MKREFKVTVLQSIIFLLGLSLLTIAGEPGNRFVNKPWEKLNEEEKNLNRAYLDEKMIGYNEKEKVSFLLSLLDDQKRCFLPREALIQYARPAEEPLRKIVADSNRPMTTRSEALVILAELGDQQITSIIENDPILKKPISAYEEIHAPEVVNFHKSYLSLKMATVKPDERTGALANMLKEGKCRYLVRKELIGLGKQVTSSLVKILSDKKNPYLVRLDALFTLKEIGDKECWPAVRAVLEDDEESEQMHELAGVTLGISPVQTWNEIRWKVGQITIEEAKIIRQIESMTDKYKEADGNEKQEILERMCEIYKEYQTTFLGIVLLNNLISIDRLDILPEPETITEREFLTFAKLMQNDEAGVLPYLNNIKNPGLHGFLMVWYAEQKGIDNQPQELKLLRKANVEQFKSQIRIQIKDLPEKGKAEFLFNIIENWESPLEYEACMPLILEEYEKNPEFISSQLKQRFLKNIPSQVPPPYTKSHTVFHELCFIAVLINDKSLVDFTLPLSHSSNPFVAYKCSMILKWLQEGVKYPFEYDEMKRLYDSRS